MSSRSLDTSRETQSAELPPRSGVIGGGRICGKSKFTLYLIVCITALGLGSLAPRFQVSTAIGNFDAHDIFLLDLLTLLSPAYRCGRRDPPSNSLLVFELRDLGYYVMAWNGEWGFDGASECNRRNLNPLSLILMRMSQPEVEKALDSAFHLLCPRGFPGTRQQ